MSVETFTNLISSFKKSLLNWTLVAIGTMLLFWLERSHETDERMIEEMATNRAERKEFRKKMNKIKEDGENLDDKVNDIDGRVIVVETTLGLKP